MFIRPLKWATTVHARRNSLPEVAIPKFVCFLIGAGLAIWTGCGGCGTSGSVPLQGPHVRLTISPARATVKGGGWLQFNAAVTGTSETAVTWSASAGKISGTGMLQAPPATSATNLTVTAISSADSRQRASVVVNVVAPFDSPTIIGTSLAPATVGIAYSARLSASGGQTPYEWSIISGSLPLGIQLNASNGTMSGIPTLAGKSSFVIGLTDKGGNTTKQNLVLLVSDGYAHCAPPTYGCARTDTAVIPLGTLPNWGGLIGANTIFFDRNFNAAYPPQYVRVTDSNSSAVAGSGIAYSGFAVGAGSGDDSHFNLDDTLFTITDAWNSLYVYGLNPATMQTGLVWYPTQGIIGSGAWSQTDAHYYYIIGGDGKVWRLNLTGCSLGGPACSPSAPKLIYNFVANCSVNSPIVFNASAGIGGGDSVFAATYSKGEQDSGTQVVAYNSSFNTCYFYNTKYGTVRSFVGTQTPNTGTVTCNGTSTVTGSGFGTGSDNWIGLNIAINNLPFQVAAVASSSSLTLNQTCPNGSWNYSTEPGTLLGTVTSPDRYSVHDARIDPSGTWLIVEEGDHCYSGSCAIVHAWQIGTTIVNNCVSSCGDHYTTSAKGWFNSIQKDDDPSPPANPVLYRSWADFSATNTADFNYLNNTGTSVTVYPGFDLHPSAKNDPLGTHNYPVFSSTYAPETPVGTISAWASNEVLGWTQGTQGPVLRFGHTFNSSLAPSWCCFTAEVAIGAVSSTGKFYIFTSDGEGTLGSTNGNKACSIKAGTCRSDVFILNLAPPPAN